MGFMNLSEINNQLIKSEHALAADRESTQPTLASAMLVRSLLQVKLFICSICM